MDRRKFLGNIIKGLMAIVALVISNTKKDENIIIKSEVKELDFYRDYTYDPTTKVATIDWSEELIPDGTSTYIMLP